MKSNIANCNQITLDAIQKALHCTVSKPQFLKMVFPACLQEQDTEALLGFLFDADSSYQSSRTIFFHGNRYKKGSTYSRAHQAELHYLAQQFQHTAAFQEMTALLTQHFRLSPDHAVFDLLKLDAERFPTAFQEMLKTAKFQQDASLLLALLILWSVFGDWVTMLSLPISNSQPHTVQSPPDKTLRFLTAMLETQPDITSIAFAFQSGAAWLTNTVRTEFLVKLIQRGIHLQILLAAADPTAIISGDLRHSEAYFHSVHHMWHAFAAAHAGQVSVRVSPVPLMHNYCCVETAEVENSQARVIFYTYHNPYIDQNEAHSYPYDTEQYRLFREEFLFLWERSEGITDFIAECCI